MSRKIFISLSLGTTLLTILCLTGCSSSAGGKGTDIAEGSEFSDQDIAMADKQRWGDGNIPMAKDGGAFEDIFFEYDSALVRPEDQETVRHHAQALTRDKGLYIELEGHCDRRGTNEYNLALGEERAKAVARLMVSYGVEPQQIKTISYGEEIPLDSRDSDDAYAKNRRVHFAPYKLASK